MGTVSQITHHSSLTICPGSGRGGSSSQTFLSRATLTRSDVGIPRCSQASVAGYSLHLVLGLPRGLLPAVGGLDNWDSIYI